MNKTLQTPQEIELWIILPAIKKQLAMILAREHKLKQQEVAKLLRVTPAAISQYMNSKRGSGVHFTKDGEEAIRKAAKNIVDKHANAMAEIIAILHQKEIKDMVCHIHKKMDPAFKHCSICRK